MCFAHRQGDSTIKSVYCGSGANKITVGMSSNPLTAIADTDTVLYQNDAGKEENFSVYASRLTNLDEHSDDFQTSTGTSLKNYFYWGFDGQESSYTGTFFSNGTPGAVDGADWDSYNRDASIDGGGSSVNSITGSLLPVGTFTSKYVIIAIPNRYGANDVNYTLKDNGTNLGFAVNDLGLLAITNPCGFAEPYRIYRSTNLLTYDTNLTVKIDGV